MNWILSKKLYAKHNSIYNISDSSVVHCPGINRNADTWTAVSVSTLYVSKCRCNIVFFTIDLFLVLPHKM